MCVARGFERRDGGLRLTERILRDALDIREACVARIELRRVGELAQGFVRAFGAYERESERMMQHRIARQSRKRLAKRRYGVRFVARVAISIGEVQICAGEHRIERDARLEVLHALREIAAANLERAERRARFRPV